MDSMEILRIKRRKQGKIAGICAKKKQGKGKYLEAVTGGKSGFGGRREKPKEVEDATAYTISAAKKD